MYHTLREFWAQKSGRLGGVSDHYLTAPLIAGFRLLDARPPAPAPLTHCRLKVCAAVLADSPSVTSIGLIVRDLKKRYS
jgi:hypothetical protein